MEENGDYQQSDRDEIYSNAVRAGKRTYFFDVRKTRGDEHFLTMTESKRRYNDDGTFHYQKHKIFLYKEDFEKFTDALADSLKKVMEFNNETDQSAVKKMEESFSDIDFESLDAGNE